MIILEGDIITSYPRLAIIISRYNRKVTDQLFKGALERLQKLNYPLENLTVIWVDGAVEIPFTAQTLAMQKQHQALICLGAVIRGDTDHYDYVCQQVSYGCQKVSLDHHIPVIFGILTTYNEEQALARAGGNQGNKGQEAIDTSLRMVSLLTQINTLNG